MITIRIEKDKINIIGHANYLEEGKDIVCASVSSMVITSVNAMIRIDSSAIQYEEKDGVFIHILKHTEVIDKLLINLIDLLEELASQYPDYIKIRRC